MKRFGACAIVIGNEVLSAKVDDQNGPLLIRRLRERGIALRGMMVVPDEVDDIVEAVGWARSRAEHVFTSGGIGPTHDDVTVRAVALALGKSVVRLPEIEAAVKEHYGNKATVEALRLAEAPEGTVLLRQPGVWYPVLSCDGMYLLPGVPQLFKVQLETVLARLEGTPLVLHCLYLSAGEAEIAGVLDEVALAMPDVAIGSYPQFTKDVDHRVKITIEHIDAVRVRAARDALLSKLPVSAVVRQE